MSEVRKKDVLLDRLVELEPCEYLSELKEPRMRPAVLRALARLDPNDYTVGQWNYVLSYITGEEIDIHSVEAVVAFMDQQITEGKQDVTVPPSYRTK